jgi:protein-S-isoprenylcysteine O-methyltransferase Ste14
MKTTSSPNAVVPSVSAGVLRRVAQVLVVLLLQAAILFVSAGKLDWLWAWIFMGTYVADILVNMYFLRGRPEQVAERGSAGFRQGWDKWISLAWAVFFYLLVPVVAGLDERLGWGRDLSLGVHLLGWAGFAGGLALFSWAMIANAYFSTVVRVQQERGHAVCTSGPYRAVRHPGYVGAVLQGLGAPLLLGSLWALVPGILAGAMMVWRTALEDRMLRAELPGYAEYAGRVRCRLLPHVW